MNAVKGEEKEAVKANVLKLLKDKYNIEEEDFVSAEIGGCSGRKGKGSRS